MPVFCSFSSKRGSTPVAGRGDGSCPSPTTRSSAIATVPAGPVVYEPQQTAESFFQPNAGETGADPLPGAGAGDHTDAGLPSDLRQDLPEICLLQVHGQPPFLDHDMKPLRCPLLARVLCLPSSPLGPGARAREEAEQTGYEADEPVSFGSVI
jgi:hypothetical protein